jgi:hypothetical protein
MTDLFLPIIDAEHVRRIEAHAFPAPEVWIVQAYHHQTKTWKVPVIYGTAYIFTDEKAAVEAELPAVYTTRRILRVPAEKVKNG